MYGNTCILLTNYCTLCHPNTCAFSHNPAPLSLSALTLYSFFSFFLLFSGSLNRADRTRMYWEEKGYVRIIYIDLLDSTLRQDKAPDASPALEFEVYIHTLIQHK